ncbi:hypothetical protein RMR16_008740 [Agrobacterium sp. rho-13.3]|uniref:hypothetical protein n=1 Tax=Agrobacterium sp. rho-13.3 TaxID=3072980 RepID=UPI002A12A1EC|nr:hypothetical protein [Agrobacterium sp. rho-13.3]MDX8310037.1 hypothetical protein [Agrobacterium sp. rho-13.3]
MIPAWLMKAVAPVFSKVFLPFLIFAVLVLAGFYSFDKGMEKIATMISDARRAAANERDNHWTAQIEKSNAMQARRETTQAVEAMRISAEASQTIANQRARLLTLEKANAALPNGTAVGLDSGRVQLLPD